MTRTSLPLEAGTVALHRAAEKFFGDYDGDKWAQVTSGLNAGSDYLSLLSGSALNPTIYPKVVGGANGQAVVTDTAYGAVAAVKLTDVATTASSTAITSAGGKFTPAMNGQYVCIRDAGPLLAASTGNPWAPVPLIGTFTYVDASHGTVSVAASSTTSGRTAYIGPDSGAAIVAALAAKSSVVIPQDAAFFTSVELPVASYQTLQGMGRNSVLISPTQQANVVTSGLTQRPIVRDLSIIGNGYGNQPANVTPVSGNPNWANAGCGIIFAGTTLGLIENCVIENCGGDLNSGGGSNRNGVGGIWLTYGCTYTTVRDNLVTNCRNAINEDNFFNSVTEHSPIGNRILNNSCTNNIFGVAIDSGSLCRGSLVQANACEQNVQSGIDIHRSKYVRVLGNYCAFNGTSYTNAGITVYGDSSSIVAEGVVVQGNVCFANGTHGIKFSDYALQYVAEGNICARNFRHGLYFNNNANNGIVKGNLAYNNAQGTDVPNAYDGLHVTSCTNVQFANNRSTNTIGTSQQYGLRVDGSSDYIDVSAPNDFSGNGPSSNLSQLIVGANSTVIPNTPENQLRLARGVRGESFPQAAANGSFVPATGDARCAAVGLIAGYPVTHLHCWVSVVGSGLTLVKLGLLDSTGKVLAVTADVKADFTSLKEKVEPLTAAFTPSTSGQYYVAVLQVGTTPATLIRGTSGITGFTTESTTGKPWGANQTGQSDLVVGNTLTLSPSGTVAWVGWD